jgi:hypothetical protein
MKAISLWQPWASLIALGIKHYETRSWSTNYRGELVIHAAKKIIPFHELFQGLSFQQQRFIMKQIIHAYGEYRNMPTGKIVATTNLINVFQTEDLLSNIDQLEKACGDYSPGRFAWHLIVTRMLDKPIPAKGQQGLWDYDIGM